MPCYDGATTPDYASSGAREALNKLKLVEAMLCGLLQACGATDKNIGELLDKVDYKKSGVSRRELEEWWRQHRQQDLQQPTGA